MNFAEQVIRNAQRHAARVYMARAFRDSLWHRHTALVLAHIHYRKALGL